MTLKTALIFGVSGQDGGYLSEFLLAKDYRVVGVSRDAEVASFSHLRRLGIFDNVELISAATNDFRSVLQALAKTEPDEVYNLSGQSSVGLSFQQPAETMESISGGTLNLLEAMRFLNRPVKFYSAGSTECFGDTGNVPANECTAFRPRSPYAVAKSAAFWQVANYREAYGFFACSGILANHESPLRPPRFVTRKITAAACRIAAGSPEQLHLGNLGIIRDWGWAPEYVDAMWRMLQQPQACDYVIGTGQSHTLEEFVAGIFTHLGLDWKKHVVVSPALFRPTDINVSRIDPSLAGHSLGWSPQVGFSELIQRLVRAESSDAQAGQTWR